MNRHLRLLALPALLLICCPLSACQKIGDYVGVWRVETSYQRTYKVYWGSETTQSEGSVSGIPSGAKLEINKDHSVIYTQSTGSDPQKGRIAFYFGKVYFLNLYFSDDLKFELKNDGNVKKLEYSKLEGNHCLDCIGKSTHVVINYVGELE